MRLYKKNQLYKVIEDLIWVYNDGEIKHFKPIDYDNPQFMTIELYEWIKSNGRIEKSHYSEIQIIMPIGSYLLKIKNRKNDGIEGFDRFLIPGTHIELAFNGNIRDNLEEVDELTQMVVISTAEEA